LENIKIFTHVYFLEQRQTRADWQIAAWTTYL